jgi:hypothetical protein
MGSRFVSGYLGLARGEKDPRNLVLSYAIVKVLVIEFDVTSLVEVSRSTRKAVLRLTVSFPVDLSRSGILLFSHLLYPASW